MVENRSVILRLIVGALLAVVAAGALFWLAGQSVFLAHHPFMLAIRSRSFVAKPALNGSTSFTPHRYNNPKYPIKTIKITAVYFVPNDLVPDPSARVQAEQALEGLKRFHEIQFKSQSTIEYRLLADTVIGEKDHRYYEIYDMPELSGIYKTTESLTRISDELESRRLVEPQDIALIYPVEYIFYEGIGAGGGLALDENNFALGGAIIPRGYLTDPEYFYANSFVAHEFYHALGVPDAYDIEGAAATALSNDLMGAGRYRSLEITYLRDEIKERMGMMQ